jgi:prepilin-type N-terminal cleavage/methylation domain-containing protein
MRLHIDNRTTGFTLLEIMVVLLLLSMLFGMGIGAFSKVGGGPTMALGRIKDVVRTARFHAVKEKAPSAVRVDPVLNVVTGLGWRAVGCWHFEDDREGFTTGFPEDMSLGIAGLAGDGVIGRCLDLTIEDGEAQHRVFVSPSPSLNSVQGVAAECFIFLKSPGPRTILSKGNAYRMDVTPDGLLNAALRVTPYEAAGEMVVSDVPLESVSFRLPLKRWVRVGFQFNGYSLYLTVDGMVRNREHFSRRMRLVPHERQALAVGEGEIPFDGYIDELHLSAAVLGEELPFKDTIQLTGKAPYTIHFDAKGFLDRDFHRGPAVIEFLHAMSRRYLVTIGLMGEVR